MQSCASSLDDHRRGTSRSTPDDVLPKCAIGAGSLDRGRGRHFTLFKRWFGKSSLQALAWRPMSIIDIHVQISTPQFADHAAMPAPMPIDSDSHASDTRVPAALPAITVAMNRRPAEWKSLALAISTTISLMPIIGLGWFIMWRAQVRLTPNPEAELLAQLAAMGEAGPMLDREYWEYGRTVYLSTCISCHGADGRGVQGNGKDLVRSEFIARTGDDEMVAFLQRGRDASDPLNTTRIQMPPKGGNPVLDEDDLYDVVEYLRGLQDPRRIPPPGTPPVSAADSGLRPDP